MNLPRLRILILLMTVSCNNSTTSDCAAYVAPAIAVEIRDSKTALPVAEGAQGAVHDGGYLDSLRPFRSSGSALLSLQAAPARPGTYGIEVQRTGYQTWTVAGVQAKAGQCGVETATVRADLIPLSP